MVRATPFVSFFNQFIPKLLRLLFSVKKGKIVYFIPVATQICIFYVIDTRHISDLSTKLIFIWTIKLKSLYLQYVFNTKLVFLWREHRRRALDSIKQSLI